MTRKEQLLEILDKYAIYRVWFGSDYSIIESRSLTAKEELADAILSLPLDVPTKEEIKVLAPERDGTLQRLYWIIGF